jgi:hypothetical protein
MRSSHTKGTEGMRIAGLRKASSVPPPPPQGKEKEKGGGRGAQRVNWPK